MRPSREVWIGDEPAAADVLVDLVDTLVDVEKIRVDATQKGRCAAAWKASTESRAISKILFMELGLDSTAVAMNLRDSQSLTRVYHAVDQEDTDGREGSGGIPRWNR